MGLQSQSGHGTEYYFSIYKNGASNAMDGKYNWIKIKECLLKKTMRSE